MTMAAEPSAWYLLAIPVAIAIALLRPGKGPLQRYVERERPSLEEKVFYALLHTAPPGSVVTMDMARTAVATVVGR